MTNFPLDVISWNYLITVTSKNFESKNIKRKVLKVSYKNFYDLFIIISRSWAKEIASLREDQKNSSGGVKQQWRENLLPTLQHCDRPQYKWRSSTSRGKIEAESETHLQAKIWRYEGLEKLSDKALQTGAYSRRNLCGNLETDVQIMLGV